MIRKFLLKMTIAAMFLALFSLKFVDVSIGERLYEYPLETAWKAMGLPLKEVSTETWMQLNDRWMSVYELKTLAEEIKAKLGLTLKAKPTYGEQEGVTYVSFEGFQRDDTIVTVTIQSNRSEYELQTQMGINTTHPGLIGNLRDYVESIRGEITDLGKNPHFKVLLLGEYKGKISSNLVRSFSGRVFQRIKAELIESAYEGGNSCQKGYTDLINDSINYNTRRVNVEIGTRFDQARNITQIVIASPSLTDDV